MYVPVAPEYITYGQQGAHTRELEKRLHALEFSIAEKTQLGSWVLCVLAASNRNAVHRKSLWIA